VIEQQARLQREATGRKFVWGGLIALFALSVIGNKFLTSSSTETEGQTAPAVNRAGPAPIESHVLKPWTRTDDPDTFKLWGKTWFARIEQLRVAAARRVAQEPACDNVDWAAMAEGPSQVRKRPVIFVSCKNGQRYFLGQDDLGKAILSEQQIETALDRTAITATCRKAAQTKNRYPLSFRPRGQ
jgi:hypothetical protein